MARKKITLDSAAINDETLLRLHIAAQLEFPDGSMTASGLRSEAARGRLAVWRIAGKDYTTKSALKEMRKRCVRPSRQDFNSAAPERTDTPSGSSKIGNAKSAQAL